MQPSSSRSWSRTAAVALATAGLAACAKEASSGPDLAYVVDTGGTAGVPAVTLIDRGTHAVVKTVTFPEHAGHGVGHFANVTADGKELWLATPGFVNVYDTAAFRKYDAVTPENQAQFVKHSFEVGDGVQSVLSPDGRYLFTGRTAAPRGINVFDVRRHAFIGNIPNAGTAPHAGAVSPDGARYYTTTAAGHTVVAYDSVWPPGRGARRRPEGLRAGPGLRQPARAAAAPQRQVPVRRQRHLADPGRRHAHLRRERHRPHHRPPEHPQDHPRAPAQLRPLARRALAGLDRAQGQRGRRRLRRHLR
ncbi:MAG: hypothetical protein QM767_23535 [Anaeromyxobacter sp.]